MLNKNVKALSPQTWEAINAQIVQYADDEKIEKARQVRIDYTVVESNIHEPTDSSLLWDSVRVLTRLLHRAKEDFRLRVSFQDHSRRAKRHLLGIMNSRNKKDRKSKYADLIKVTTKSISGLNRTKERLTIVIDKGMNSDNNYAWIDEHSRIHFVTTYSTYFAQEIAATPLERFEIVDNKKTSS